MQVFDAKLLCLMVQTQGAYQLCSLLLIYLTLAPLGPRAAGVQSQGGSALPVRAVWTGPSGGGPSSPDSCCGAVPEALSGHQPGSSPAPLVLHSAGILPFITVQPASPLCLHIAC